MTKQKQGKRKTAIRISKRLRLAVIFGILVVIAALVYCHIDYLSIDERLAIIEASRAIPDSENAAILYDRLLQNPDASLNDQSEFLEDDSDMLTRRQSWTGNDYPNIAVWIKEHQWLINELMKVSQFEKCRFPLIVEPYRIIQVKRISTMRKWEFLLCRAANNDVGEGRIDDAIAKWQCMIQIGKHLRQQSQLIEYLGGMAIEGLGIFRAIAFLAEGNAAEHHLRKIESFQVQKQDDWTAVLDRILPVEELGEQKFKRQLSLISRLKYEFGFGPFSGRKDPYQILQGQHLRTLVNRRGMYIMVALRRYKNENGHWPQTLDRIKPWVAEDVLTDPQNNGTFIYHITENGFRLYSTGPNGKDENGRYTSNGPDDWAIWPSRSKISQPKQKDKDSKQSDTDTEKKVIE